MSNILRKSIEVGGRTLTLETGRMAKQAGGAVFATYGDTMVLACATMSAEPRQGIDFFPLQVEYEEKMYSVGKIPGGFIKREGRPSEKAILSSRIIDRPLRPLFPKGFRNDVQVITTVMSVDQDNPPDMTAMIGASAAVTISNIPFNGPIAGVTIGLIDGEYIINPTVEQKELSEKIKKLRSEIEKQSSRSMTTDMFIGLVRKYTRARKLTPRMLNELIEKIEVFNAEKIDGVWEQRLRIHYNCVGTIEIPTVLPLPIPEVSVNTRKGVVVNYAPCELAV